MLFAKRLKAGYTLVEVLVVVSILGILSAMGVAGLQQAVANARVKDAAVNTAKVTGMALPKPLSSFT